jgi:hypothetical protein
MTTITVQMMDVSDFLRQDLETLLRHEREETQFLFTLNYRTSPLLGRIKTYPHYMSRIPQVDFMVVEGVEYDFDAVELIGEVKLSS